MTPDPPDDVVEKMAPRECVRHVVLEPRVPPIEFSFELEQFLLSHSITGVVVIPGRRTPPLMFVALYNNRCSVVVLTKRTFALIGARTHQTGREIRD